MTGRKPQTSSRDYDWGGVELTPLDEGDAETIFKWQNAPEVRDQTMGFRFPVQREAVKEWLREIRQQNGRERIVYAIRARGRLVGTVQLHSIDHYQRRSLFGIYVGDTQEMGQGLGHVATALILDYAFKGLDLRKVGLEVVSTNRAAIRLYEKLGFVREGVKRKEYFLDGAYQDTWIYGMLSEEFDVALPPQAHRLVFSNPQPGAGPTPD